LRIRLIRCAVAGFGLTTSPANIQLLSHPTFGGIGLGKPRFGECESEPGRSRCSGGHL